MKKILAVILTLVLTLGAAAALTACSGSDKGLTVAVPNDTTNEARALLLLEDKGYIKLKDGAGITATVKDIAENPYNLDLQRGRGRAASQRAAGCRLRRYQLQLCHFGADLNPAEGFPGD